MKLGARSFLQVFHVGASAQAFRPNSAVFPRYSIRELDQKWSYQNSKWCSQGMLTLEVDWLPGWNLEFVVVITIFLLV